jgi:uncharacterized pyridoxal phosphate-containing UPF0001 family protein
MTIGSLQNSLNSKDVNQDFKILIDCRKQLCTEFNIDENQIELSMGMSNDFEQAVKLNEIN